MLVFSVPLSVPFLLTVVAALIDGKLVAGFEARNDPARLAEATLYLPTLRAVRVAREVFLDELRTDAAVLMTHSFEQDSHILSALMDGAQEFPCAYVGVLGPQRRTRETLAEAARLRGLEADAEKIESWLATHSHCPQD